MHPTHNTQFEAGRGKGHPIRWSLFGLVSLPLLALIVALAYDTVQRYRSATEDAYRMTGTVLATTVVQTDQFLSGAKHILAELSKRPEVRRLDPKRCDPVLAEVKKLQPAYANVFTLDVDGRLVCSVAPITPETAKGPDQKYFFAELSRNPRFIAGKPAKGFVTGRWVSTLAYPLFDEAGQFNGAVATSVDLSNYQPHVSRDDLSAAISVGIVNSDGTVIAVSHDRATTVGSKVDSQSFRAMLKDREGHVLGLNSRGESHYYTFSPIESTDLIAFASIEEAAVRGPLIAIVVKRILWVLALVTIVGLSTAWFARRLALPVEAISDVMKSVSRGAVDVRATPRGPTELRNISTQLNAMLDQRDRAEVELRQSEERFRGLFEHSRQPTYLVEDGRIIAANWATLKLFGMKSFDQLIGESAKDLSPERQPDGSLSSQRSNEFERSALANGSNDFEWEHLRLNGEAFTVHVSLTAIEENRKKRLHVVLTDITAQKKAIERIRFLAYRDPLTGLPNKTSAVEHLDQVIAAAHARRASVCLLHIDLNKLRYTNETHGHAVGDALIKAVGDRLNSFMRPGHTLSRLLGDEFMVVVDDVASLSDIAAYCDSVLAYLAAPYEVEGLQLAESFSIGIVVYPQDGDSSDTLLRNADAALSAAKLGGPNHYRFFEPHMNAVAATFTNTRDGLKLAIERSEFVIHYQPQIDLISGKIVGAEALLRWARPGADLTMPDRFIGVAEESGLIAEIGRWVLNEVCRQAKAWEADGLAGIVYAVNLSAVQFRQGRVEQEVYEALFHHNLNPQSLELELTESILLQGASAVTDILERWEERGIQISIDDFGTGYSSLSYLKNLKINKLKIDKSFIGNLPTDAEDRAIVQAIIEIAHALKLMTIAEGVESADIMEQLKRMGCRQAQGYLFTKPLPAAEFRTWVEHYRASNPKTT